ncbi:MAG: DUF6438 domain-containing protein [Mucilaginibacter sp.]|uniref:DUF6438 domain-containing protein n=1 Tax=Mucilaginibacter sp. TaxID=1882438 RepID=UPI003263D5BC
MKRVLFVPIFLLLCSISGCKSEQKIKFERIIFHTSICFGTCPVYHLEVNDHKRVKLYAETVFKTDTDLYDEDHSKMGYFIGTVNNTTFTKLLNNIEQMGLDSIKFNNASCCDGSLITIIVYYNGKRKYLRSMFPPEKANKLISTLYEICGTNLKRSGTQFNIESEKK